MTQRPDDRQLAEAIAELETIADRLRHGIPDQARDGKRWSLSAFALLAKARVRTRDGFPASSGPGGGSGTKKGGDYGGGVVPSLALAGDSDLDRGAWVDLNTDLQLMLNYGRHAVDVLAKATPVQQHPDRPEFGCRVCSRPGQPEPIYRSERCEWCYRFWLLWKVDVPQTVLKLRREGKRITEAAIRTEIQEELAG